jgi:hypothetical protein
MSNLPSLFIGSSSEGLDIAKAVELQLMNDADVRIWTDSFDQLGKATLQTLMDALDEFDFAVMVISPDDLLESRDQGYNSPRDNVLFELGLFMGRIGPERTFILHEDNPKLKLPSDLAGITRVKYRVRNKEPNVSPACTLITKSIRRLGVFQQRNKEESSDLRAFDEVNSAFLALKNEVLKGNLKITRAEFIQHSSERAFSFVNALAAKQADIRLYLQHPETLDVLCGDLKVRVTARIDSYSQHLSRQKYKGKFQTHLYKTPASFNGVRLCKEDGSALLVLSWYVYLSNKPLTNLIHSKFGGSENPCFVMADTYPEYSHFNLLFDNLVSSCETQSVSPVFQMDNGICEWQPGWPAA